VLLQLKGVRGKVTTFERKQEEKNREVDYLKQELANSEQAKEHTDKLIASLQSHLEQETLKANELANKVRGCSCIL
jgi:chromosome segregation ATPase